MVPAYDALLVVSFGGPDGPDDVMPFLERVLRGRNVPRERMLEVAEHYHHFGGASPINAQNRDLIAALEREFAEAGLELPIFWGNRNWHPLLSSAVHQMKQAGVRRALAFVTSAFSSYSGCRQYLENIAAAQAEVGADAPPIDKLRTFFNHPGFIESMIERVSAALEQVEAERRAGAHLLFTAHSIPLAMAANCRYERQFHEASRLVADGIGRSQWRLVYQSRSGPPSQPWLGPDIGEALREIAADSGSRDVVAVPIGFISDHLEVAYDLDYEARQLAEKLGLNLVRAATAGTHPRFVRMIRELVEERMGVVQDKPALGTMGKSHDVCDKDCCLPGALPKRPVN